jgi:hypothetical protein
MPPSMPRLCGELERSKATDTHLAAAATPAGAILAALPVGTHHAGASGALFGWHGGSLGHLGCLGCEL